MTKTQITWAISTVATVLAVVAATIGLWPQIGWTTPNAHAADVKQMIAARMVSEEAVIDAIKESRDEWKCDEYEEELIDALHEQEDGDNSVELRRIIELIRKKMDKLDCSRFEDFG